MLLNICSRICSRKWRYKNTFSYMYLQLQLLLHYWLTSTVETIPHESNLALANSVLTKSIFTAFSTIIHTLPDSNVGAFESISHISSHTFASMASNGIGTPGIRATFRESLSAFIDVLTFVVDIFLEPSTTFTSVIILWDLFTYRSSNVTAITSWKNGINN